MSVVIPKVPEPSKGQRLLNKVVAITGAGGAIGRGCALEMAAQGATIAVADTQKQNGEETVRLIKEAGGSAMFTELNVTEEKQVESWIAAVVAAFGRLDVLVNNAAAFVFGTIEEATSDGWDKVLSVNVKGYALCAKYAVQQFKKQGAGGAIVNMASISSFIAQPAFVPYNTSKGAILQLTRCLAFDHGKDGIRVNSVCPGTIDTPATSLHAQKLGITKEQLTADTVKDHCIKRLGHVRDVAMAVIFLASDESSFVSGVHLPVDGGVLTH